MKISVDILKVAETTTGYLEDVPHIFDTADCATFLVASFTDRDSPYIQIPEGYHITGFRFFAHENSITVYICRAILVAPND